MRLSAMPAILALAVVSVAAHASNISVTAVASFPVTSQSPNNDNDMLSFTAASATVSYGGTFSQAGTFYDGYIPTNPVDAFTFDDTFTVDGVTKTLTFSGTDAPTNAFDTLTIYALGPVTFGTTNLTFGEVTAVNYFSDGGIPVSLDATVSAAPEPSSLVLLGTGILGLAGTARRRMSR